MNYIPDMAIHGLIVFECEGLMKSYDKNGGEYGTFSAQFSSLGSMWKTSVVFYVEIEVSSQAL